MKELVTPCDSGACVTVSPTDFGNVRLSLTEPGSPALFLTEDEFTNFIRAAKEGFFDELL